MEGCGIPPRGGGGDPPSCAAVVQKGGCHPTPGATPINLSGDPSLIMRLFLSAMGWGEGVDRLFRVTVIVGPGGEGPRARLFITRRAFLQPGL